MRHRAYMQAFIFLLTIGFRPGSVAQSSFDTLLFDLPYYSDAVRKSDSYLSQRCKLDVYLPTDTIGFPTVVWFHGGGLRAGAKSVPEALKKAGIGVVAPNYRLHPQVQAPVYIEDAAAAVAWVFDHIADYGGNPEQIFISGYSAGGYLASMIGLDEKWLAKHGIEANRIAGLIPFSGHAITHFTVREERGIPGEQPIIDELAPLYYVRSDAPTLLLITGDRELELLGRYEENAYMMRMMRVAGHTDTRLLELDGYGHDMLAPALPLLIREIKSRTKK